jgi:hypothetical protein
MGVSRRRLASGAICALVLLACSDEVTTVDTAGGAGGAGAAGAGAAGGGGESSCVSEGCGSLQWARQIDDGHSGVTVLDAAATSDGGILVNTTAHLPIDLGFGPVGQSNKTELAQPLIVELDGVDGTIRAAVAAHDTLYAWAVGASAGPQNQRVVHGVFFGTLTIGGDVHATPVAPHIDPDSGAFLPSYQGGVNNGKAWIASLDPSLDVAWSLSFGDDRYPPENPDDTLSTMIGDVELTDDDGLLLVGGFRGEISAAPLTLARKGIADVFVMRLSSDGVPQSLKGFGGSGSVAAAWWLEPRSDGGYAIGGELDGTVDLDGVRLTASAPTDLPSSSFGQSFVASLDAGDTARWGHVLSGRLGEAQPLGDDGLWIPLVFRHELRFDGTSLITVADDGLAAVELAADGTLVDARLLLEGSLDWSTAALSAGDGTVFLSARYRSLTVDGTTLNAEPDAVDLWIGALGPSGALRWQHDLGTSLQSVDQWYGNILRPTLLHEGDPVFLGEFVHPFAIGTTTFDPTPYGVPPPVEGGDGLIVKLAR